MGRTHGFRWTKEKVEELRELKKRGLRSKDIAEAWGMTLPQILKACDRYLVGREAKNPISQGKLITLESIKERYDIRSQLKEELGKLPRGQYIEEAELSRSVAGTDRARFRRCINMHLEDFAPWRIKLKITPGEPRWYWGHPEDIQKARDAVEQYL